MQRKLVETIFFRCARAANFVVSNGIVLFLFDSLRPNNRFQLCRDGSSLVALLVGTKQGLT